jgi:hypothetical protein
VNLLWLLLLGAIGWFGWRKFRGVQRIKNERERALAIRGTVALCILLAIFTGGMIAMPGKGRILLAIPLVLVMGSAWRAFRNSRREIRDAANLEAKLDRMKRVN